MKQILTSFLIVIGVFAVSNNTFAQCDICPIVPQLVPNGDFETVFEPICSDGSTMGNIFFDRSPVDAWIGVTNSTNLIGSVETGTEVSRSNTPDFLSEECAETGNSSFSCGEGSKTVGIWTAFNTNFAGEFIQIKLAAPLVANKEYCMQFNALSYVEPSLQDIFPSFEASDGLGFYLSADPIIIENDTTPAVVSVNYQQTINTDDLMDTNVEFAASDVQNTNSLMDLIPYWQQPDGVLIPEECTPFTANFCANGGEQWLVFGNFKAYEALTFENPTTDQFSYVVLDDISLQLIDTLGLVFDEMINADTLECGDCVDLIVDIQCDTFLSVESIVWNQEIGETMTNTINVCPETNTTYTVDVTYTGTCATFTERDSIQILVRPCVDPENVVIVLPNVMTPNNDSFNDNFNYYFVDEFGEIIEDATIPVVVRLFQVYNRWGQLVYNNETPTTGWDGRFKDEYATQDVYVYNIEIEIGEGTETETIVRQGDVTLIR